jgi:hypothetical protein
MQEVRDRTRPLTPYKGWDITRLLTSYKGWVSRVYKWFLELPVIIVLAVLWVAGGVLMGLFALALYYFFWLLLRVGAGA